MRPVRSLLFVIVLGTLLAGCAGKTKAPPASTEAEDPYALGDGVTNVLQGLVLSADGLPLEAALVKLPAVENLNTTTNAFGEYRFENLEPRDYIVVVEKEGYRTKTQRAIVEDGKIFQLDFKVEERPSTAPYSEVLPWTAFLSCQVAYASNPESVEKRDCAEAQTGVYVDPNNDPVEDFAFGSGGAQIVVEATWVPTQSASRNLSIAVSSVGLQSGDIEFGSTTGPPGLKVPIGQSLMGRYFSQGGQIRVELAAAPGALNRPDDYDAGFTMQQDVNVYVTVFYIDVGPPGYSAIEG
jgi:hypothetical protein